MSHKCQTAGCLNDATLQCPTCMKLGIKGSYFCTQDCFKGSWKEHKAIHNSVNLENAASTSKSVVYNPWPEFNFTGALRPFPVTEKRKVPDTIERPDYADHPDGRSLSEEAMRGDTTVKLLNDEEIQAMRIVGILARECLDEGAKAIEVGITTDEIDRLVHEAAIERDCYPSPLNYYLFPKSCCTSVNEVICHGIPDKRKMQDGDICKLDITVYHHGFHGDLCETLFVGNVSEKHKKLVRVAHESLNRAIAICEPGVRFREIGNVIQKYVTRNGFSVVKDYNGHGIHNLFHTAPSIFHYAKNKAVGVMQPGNTFTIEPMISEGGYECVKWPDKWSAVTADGRYSAQFEQTLLITQTGCDILTKRLENDGQPWFMDK